jgi:hypothetical protein
MRKNELGLFESKLFHPFSHVVNVPASTHSLATTLSKRCQYTCRLNTSAEAPGSSL